MNLCPHIYQLWKLAMHFSSNIGMFYDSHYRLLQWGCLFYYDIYVILGCIYVHINVAIDFFVALSHFVFSFVIYCFCVNCWVHNYAFLVGCNLLLDNSGGPSASQLFDPPQCHSLIDYRRRPIQLIVVGNRWLVLCGITWDYCGPWCWRLWDVLIQAPTQFGVGRYGDRSTTKMVAKTKCMNPHHLHHLWHVYVG